ncbi:MAG TPA: hypothetical protein DCY64_12360 [Hydrogenophaga sp.]|uniref:ATP-grasp domain-containing protein n=1 Tax=Hydrogenophaga sp. TaxID=1904254 RepID=UPI000E90F6D0|nr:ATP-grasp domain-containing protein [Hydrogenophaga sp.]HAX21061.1 hypothetical protein [Hydrogenophaga sp.]HBU18968.1 hypothetical protein [Hydrogenophaga sp.]
MKKVKLLYNLREDHPKWHQSDSFDQWADWDIEETVHHVHEALRELEVNVTPIRIKYPVDFLAFDGHTPIISLCEMIGGSFREAIIPSICEAASTAYAFSTPEVMLTTLDKGLCNYLVRDLGVVKVPRWSVSRVGYRNQSEFDGIYFPCIIKPLHEGSGIGISDSSVAYDFDTLQSTCSSIKSIYMQDVLVQEYIPGKEVTVGVIGTGKNSQSLAPIEMDLKGHLVYGFEAKERPAEKIIVSSIADKSLEDRIKLAAVSIHNGLGCRDCSRIDLRVSENGEIHFIEINPLPHLHPKIGDFCRSGTFAGFQYTDLLSRVFERILKA